MLIDQPFTSNYLQIQSHIIIVDTQLHSGDIAYFPIFDYPTGVHQEAADAGGEGEEEEEAGGRRKRAATSLRHRLWPDGVIYYIISNHYTGIIIVKAQNFILAAILSLQSMA